VKVVTNEKLIESRTRIAKLANFGGLGILILAMALSFRPGKIIWAYVALILGLVLVSVATYNASKWVKEPRSDQLLAKAMKGFGRNYRLYNYTLPVDHALLCPYGLLILKVKGQEGEIVCQGKKWHRKFSLRRLWELFFQESLGNPTMEVQREIEALRRFIGSAGLSPDAEVPIEGVIVFTNPKAKLEISDPLVPVVHIRELKPFLRKLRGRSPIPEDTHKALARFFDEAST